MAVRSAMSKPQSVLIVGGTGKTGSIIVDELLEDSKFHVIAAIRPASASKPAVDALKTRGAEIRIVDLESSSVEQLQEQLKDVDTVISAIEWTQLHLQDPLIKASKVAGVKRFIPCDWSTACAPGIMRLYDEKDKYHKLIKELGLGYTFIDVGWWHQVTLPIIDPSTAPYPSLAELSKTIFGTGDVKSASVDYRDIGKFVSRIIADDRTLNKYVFCWGDEYTQNEMFALAERIVGKPIPTKQIPAETLSTILSGVAPGSLEENYFQYVNSLFVRGDNTIENAKKEEYGAALDARDLYPDLKPRSLEAFAKEHYTE